MKTFGLHLQALTLFCLTLCLQRTAAFDPKDIKTAINITWSSINFKTILEWKPKPENYTYTVEVSGKYTDWEKRCIRSMETECDVTSLLEDVKDTHTARVISDIPVTEDFVEEFPHAESPKFIPYEQTILGKPVIDSFELNKDDGKLNIFIKDAVTPYRFPNGSFKTIRDIFQNDLRYTLFYRKASSTGRKQVSSTTNEIVINAENGESYCFFVRATILSRKANRDSQDSDEKCTPDGHNASRTLLPEYMTLCTLILIYWLL
uniref:Tissue factor n=1 Tax=Leptobrachium leishanense TaxID=445787 RepID=A0A8C5QQT9_9ANUR